MAAFEVIALDTATPQLRAPGASDTYTFPRAVEMPLGTANGVLYLNGSKVMTSGSALTFDGTNLGIGTSSPAGKLDTRGTGYIGSDSNNALVVDSTSSLVTIGAAGRTSYSTSALRFLTSDGTAALERMRLDSSGNLGLGVTPSATGASQTSLEVGQLAAIVSNPSGNTSTNVAQNAYYDGTNWKYRNTSVSAARYEMTGANSPGSTHAWYVSAGGTAGNAISFTQAMTLEANGNLSVGTTDTTAVRFKVQSGSDPIVFLSGFNGAGTMGVIGANPLAIYTNGTERARIPAAGGMVVGTAALATSATDGFLYVPTCAGTPTGTPTTQTGTAPIVVNTTNNKLYFYSGGQWRDAGP